VRACNTSRGMPGRRHRQRKLATGNAIGYPSRGTTRRGVNNKHGLPRHREIDYIREITQMSLASEFKEFAMKGSVVDLAVGVIIGAAFGKIVSSLVGDIFMPVLGKAIGGFNFSDLAVDLGKDPTGKEVLIKYGTFLQMMFDFLVIAVVLFIAIKGLNRLKMPPVVVAPPPPPAPVPREQVLLEEIRDLLAKR
jgi:large conductance mechanosensitive channel